MKFLYFINLLLTALSPIFYLSVFVSPDFFWPAGFLSLGIPFALVGHFFFLLIWLKKRLFGRAKWSGLALLAGLGFVKITLALPSGSAAGADNLSVLSYNVRVFNLYDADNKGFARSDKMIDWVTNEKADIKCFQEFYNQDSSDIFSVSRKIRESGLRHAYVKSAHINRHGGQFGLAIFSRHPMVRAGRLDFGKKTKNGVIFADLKIGKDTLRVYNLHLQSMSIDSRLPNPGDTEKIRAKVWDLAGRLKSGFVRRAEQIDRLSEHLAACPYKIILCGDLNDLPYSYTYFKLKSHLNNAFEDAAGGSFGFSYNGSLFFLRIDNQFYTDKITVSGFETLREIDFSDHFPLRAVYSLETPAAAGQAGAETPDF